MLMPDAFEYIKQYLITRETEALDDAIAALEKEKVDPSLQVPILQLDHMTYDDAARLLSEKPVLKFSLQHVTDVWPEGIDRERLQEGKLIRVAAVGQPAGSFIIMEIVHIDPKFLVLYVPGSQGVEGL